MILTENFKLIIVSLLSVAAYIQALSAVHLQDINVERTDTEWICDEIKCPLNSERCFVSVSNEEDPSILNRLDICFGEDNKILEKKNSSSTSDPNYRIVQHLNSYRNGYTSTFSEITSIHVDEKQYNETVTDMENIKKEIEKKIKEIFNWGHFLE